MRMLSVICFLFLSVQSFAQAPLTPDEIETRAREVGRSLRCVVCQNQSIEESDASLAKDMRVIVRERIASGESDAQIVEFMRSRYGDYVLLKPPVQRNTYLLWFLPILVIAAMVFWLFRFARSKQANPSPPEVFSEEEQIVLKRLMEENT